MTYRSYYEDSNQCKDDVVECIHFVMYLGYSGVDLIHMSTPDWVVEGKLSFLTTCEIVGRPRIT